MTCTSSSKMVGEGVRKILVKDLVVGQKILILRRVCIMERVNFLKGLQGVFGENSKFHNCSVLNENMFQRIQYAQRFIRGKCCTQTYFRTNELAWAPKY